MTSPIAILMAMLLMQWTDSQASTEPTAPVERFVDEALARAPSIAALRARLAAANARIAAAAALPDPTAEMMLQDIGVPNRNRWDDGALLGTLELKQRLALPNKRSARRAAALSASGVAAAELVQLRQRLATEVRCRFGQLYAIDRERELLVTARELLGQLAEAAAARNGAGQVEQEALVKAQLESLRLAERDDDLLAERRSVVAGLNRLVGRPPDAFVDDVVALPAVELAPQPWSVAAQSNAAALAVARAGVDAATSAAAAVAVERWPDFMVGGALGMQSPASPLVQLRFGVDLPVWYGDKQEPLERAAQSELRQAKAELRDLESLVQAELTRLAARWERDQAQIERQREATLPQTATALDAARVAYHAGRGDFSTVVEDFHLWLDARVQLARREADRFTTWAEVEQLVAARERSERRTVGAGR